MDDGPQLPKGLRRLLSQLTYADKLRKFRYAHDRDPESDEEMEAFVIDVARGLYNVGAEEWPEDDEELA
jgi:hypothetical protein